MDKMKENSLEKLLTAGTVYRYKKELLAQSEELFKNNVWTAEAVRWESGRIKRAPVLEIKWWNQDKSMCAIATLVHGEYLFFPGEEPTASVIKIGADGKIRPTYGIIFIRHLPVHPNRFG